MKPCGPCGPSNSSPKFSQSPPSVYTQNSPGVVPGSFQVSPASGTYDASSDGNPEPSVVGGRYGATPSPASPVPR